MVLAVVLISLVFKFVVFKLVVLVFVFKFVVVFVFKLLDSVKVFRSCLDNFVGVFVMGKSLIEFVFCVFECLVVFKV